LDDPCHLVVGHRRVQRQRADLLGELLDRRQAPGTLAELGVCAGPVDREGVVDGGRDPALAEELAQRVSPTRADDEQVVDVVTVLRSRSGQLDARALQALAKRRPKPAAGAVVPTIWW
jgi:hypothetical protein